MRGTRKTLKKTLNKNLNKSNIQRCTFLFSLLLVLTLSSCSLSPVEEEEEEPYVNLLWVGMMLNLHIIEKLIEHDEGGEYVRLLRGEGIENDYRREEQEENYLVLTTVEVLIEAEEGVVLNFDDTEWKIHGENEYRFIDVSGPLRESARLGEVTWCEEEEVGLHEGALEGDTSVIMFYTEWYDKFIESYSTEEEYLESIEDYVNCGSGYI